jgi:S1-C subfamily serine protease
MSSSRLSLFAAAVAAALVASAPSFAAHTTSTPAPLGTGVVNVTTNLGYQNASAAGTGMVLTASGEILTNNHVIRGATTIRVIDPSSGRTYPATVIGYSVANDVAVLQLQGASHLRTVQIASLGVKVGQRVTAVGNAGGANGKPIAAAGKVTALGQSITASDGQGISEQLVSLIQTDAALQPGDSGGPLLNASGRVVGMNTAASVGFQFQGGNQAYAIPIGRALSFARLMVAGQASATIHVGSTPFLGVSVGQSPSGGLLVASVVPGSPADLTGTAQTAGVQTIAGPPQ